jgi:predicted transcriptional regulator
VELWEQWKWSIGTGSHKVNTNIQRIESMGKLEQVSQEFFNKEFLTKDNTKSMEKCWRMQSWMTVMEIKDRLQVCLCHLLYFSLLGVKVKEAMAMIEKMLRMRKQFEDYLGN